MATWETTDVARIHVRVYVNSLDWGWEALRRGGSSVEDICEPLERYLSVRDGPEGDYVRMQEKLSKCCT